MQLQAGAQSLKDFGKVQATPKARCSPPRFLCPCVALCAVATYGLRSADPAQDCSQPTIITMRSSIAMVVALGLVILTRPEIPEIPGSLRKPRALKETSDDNVDKNDTSGGTEAWRLHPMPNLLQGPSCPGELRRVPGQMVLAILLSLGTYAGLAATCWLAAYLWFAADQARWALAMKWLLPIFVAVPVGLLVSMQAAPQIQGKLEISIPREWKQVPHCRLHWLAAPEDVLPKGCNSNLGQETSRQRLEYYFVLIILVTFSAGLMGLMLTLAGRGIRAISRCFSESASGPSQSANVAMYDPLTSAEEASTQQIGSLLATIYVFSFNALCAALAVWAMATEHLTLQNGLCWELWLGWFTAMLAMALIQGIYFAARLPSNVQVPNMGICIVTSVLPILSEPLDTFKDWLFVGLALSTRTRFAFSTFPGALMALVGVGILGISGAYMLQFHSEELEAGLLPVRAANLRAWLGRPEESFLSKQTSPAKLAIALTEDLPQAALQTFFIFLYGGSNTQSAFIGIAVLKILVCVTLRATLLEREGRFGDAYEAQLLFYRLKWQVGSMLLGEHSEFALQAKRMMASSLGDLGRHAEALVAQKEVLAAQQQECSSDILVMLDPGGLEKLQQLIDGHIYARSDWLHAIQALWQEYTVDRYAIKLKRRHRCTALDRLGGEALTQDFVRGLGLMEDLDQRVNEVSLWHGTSPQNAFSIARYGAGTYFAECSSKSDEYARDDAEGIHQGLYCLLLCRVLLGEPLHLTAGGDQVGPLVRAALDSDLLLGKYDSVLGDRRASVGTYREFIVYDDYMAYPEYIVVYTRQPT
ncbi:KCNB2 [Symbiodinium sp. CCMP2456]|nr:KCNB2 [Symbiodinium sp. CCMP2456]